jgi:alpha-tubulin suppressor-like RCC1 family protein
MPNIRRGMMAAAATAGGDGFSLYGWGLNTNGELGLGDLTNRSSPVQVGTLTDWAGGLNIQNKIMSSASDTDHFIKADNTTWATGKETYGELGVGTTTARVSSPVQVGSLTDWDKIVGGSGAVLAIKTDGTLWGWGGNWGGQLGNGNKTNYSSPIQIGSETDWTDIGIGKNTGMGIRGGKFFTMGGREANGQDWVTSSSPVQIGTATNWTSCQGAADNSFAIAGGAFYATGNGGGVNGDGTTSARRTFVQVGSLTDWSKACGLGSNGYTAMALKTDGTIWGWGYNYNGILAVNSSTNYSSPIQVGDSSDWLDIQLGGGHCIGIRDSGDGETGTLWTWGRNDAGQLGLGNTTGFLSSPNQVGSDADWRSVSAGYDWSFGVR